MKKIVFFYGEKGGVGKSQAVIWITENMIKNDCSFSIVEMDAINDIHGRYESSGISKYAPMFIENDTNEGGVNRLFNALTENQNDIVLINMPVAATSKIDPISEDLVSSLKDMGYEVIVVFISDNQKISLELYEKTMKDGIMSKADKTVVVNNLLFGDYPEYWHINKTKNKPNLMISMKKMERETNDAVMLTPDKPLLDIVQNDTINAFQARRVKSWIEEAAPLVNFILEK